MTKFRGWTKKILSPARRRVLDAGRKLWPGAAIGVTAGWAIFAAILGSVLSTGLGWVADIVLSVVAGLLLILLGNLLVLLALKLIRSLPARFITAVVASGALFLAVPGSDFGKLLFLFALANGALIGFACINGPRKAGSIAVIAFLAAGDIYSAANFLGRGADDVLPAGDARRQSGTVLPAADDPSVNGTYKTRTLCYGSGWDARRPEYGPSAALRTPTVDVTPFLDDTTGIGNTLREWYWGFDLKHCPLNARTWYPEGEGPFPLVLMVHGNHQMEKYSESGYDYLGSLLASRGFIFVSVDENFLNGNWVKDYQQNENFARGWLLLEHLQQWRAWNAAPGNPFSGKVDTGNIALIGHSRGGQAVAIAAAANRLSRYQTKATIPFQFGFQIKGIIQIAPIDPYEPTRGHHIELRDINYLLLQGGYDGDVSTFLGERQYNRVHFSGTGYFFKSAVYIHRANHGQFNTAWGREDNIAPVSWLMNLRPILSPGDQEKIARIYVAGFLEAVLHGRKGYVRFLRDYRTMADRLPEDHYISQFEDSGFRIVDDYEQGMDVTAATMSGVTITGENLKTWSLNGLEFRNSRRSPQDNNVVFLGWDRKDTTTSRGTPKYTFSFSGMRADSFLPGISPSVVFSLCSNRDDSGDSLDIAVAIEDAAGESAELPLSRFATISPPLAARLGKYAFIQDFGASKHAERVLQRFSLPLSAFARANPNLNPSTLRRLSFVFDRSASGEIALDDVGFESGEEEEGP
jgi:hypothetical protein